MKCIHWWVLEDPDGKTSRGECRNCGAKRTDFNNVPPAAFEPPLPRYASRRLDETLARIRA